jgi:hypothetical protein
MQGAYTIMLWASLKEKKRNDTTDRHENWCKHYKLNLKHEKNNFSYTYFPNKFDFFAIKKGRNYAT